MIDRWKTKKGDVFYASLSPIKGSEQDGKRPVVVIQNDLGNIYSPTIIVAPLTEVLKKEKLPTHLLLPEIRFLKYDSMILLEQIRTIDRCRLDSYLGRLPDYILQDIDNALINIFSINLIGYLVSLGIGDYYVKKNEELYSGYYCNGQKERNTSKSQKQKRGKRYGC